MAFVYDAEGDFEHRVNPDSVIFQRIETEHWESVCRSLIERHAEATQSKWAMQILTEWEVEKAKFWQVVPKEMIERLEQPFTAAATTADGAAE
jgi:glutamate synthase (NADPH/NADH) large chain